MAETYSLLTGDGRIEIFKDGPEWRRDRRVTVVPEDGGPALRLDFPADRDSAVAEGLDPGRRYVVVVERPRLWQRLTRPAVRLRATPRPRRLRVLVSGSGRCGTQSVARFLDGQRLADGTPVAARHETLWQHLLPVLVAGDRARVRDFVRGFQHDVEAAPHFSLVPDLIEADTVVHLIRDGRRVVQSGLNRGWYQKDSVWNRIKPDLPGDTFEKCCRFWVHTNTNMAGVADLTVRLEDLAGDPEAPARLLADLGLAPSRTPFPLANAGRKPSDASGWTDRQRAVFREICGELMDRYYPGWDD